MASAKRVYSQKTLKILFANSGNECAAPECVNRIVAEGGPHSDPAVVGQICHIYAAADNGPRGKPGLTAKERNSLPNLVLLCGHHHPIVDKQHRDYPAPMLLGWKAAHEAKFQKDTAEAAKRLADIHQIALFQQYVDQQINLRLDRIRKARFLQGYNFKDPATLARQIYAGELSGGSREIKLKALAWCARLIVADPSASLDDAKDLLAKATSFGTCEESVIAEAFIATDKAISLSILARLNSSAARSAALRVAHKADGAEGAISWFDASGLSVSDLDSEGKMLLMIDLLATSNWDRALALVSSVADEEIRETPALGHTVAMALVAQSVAPELRIAATSQIPFEARTFPLSSDDVSLAARRRAGNLMIQVSQEASSFGLLEASGAAADYGLWLQLRDPHEYAGAFETLRKSMADLNVSLRRVPMALQFGIQLDLDAVERLVDQRVALSGGGSQEEAYVRFALAFTKGDAQAAAEYISRHREQLHSHLNKTLIQTKEIEFFARAGLVERATILLADAISGGLPPEERDHLSRVIEEESGGNPVAARRKQFETSNTITDLHSLVVELESRRLWIELSPYSLALFERTNDITDAERHAAALNNSEQYRDLYSFLAKHPDYVRQSILLQTTWAWSLFREGNFSGTKAVLTELMTRRQDENDRALYINLAISSGDWEDLAHFTTQEWNSRNQRSAQELLVAGQLAEAVNAPHARELVVAAAENGRDQPEILATAYFHASSAGWDRDEIVGGWLHSAAALSGTDGPLRAVTLKDIFDQKPQWDKQEREVWQLLNAGRLPMFGAAKMLGRSLIDFTLLTSLANQKERDPRRRNIVYAYSGARPPLTLPPIETIALDLAATLTFGRLGVLDTVIASYSRVCIPANTLGWLFEERRSARFHQPSRISDAAELKRLIAERAITVLPALKYRSQPLDQEIGTDLADLLSVARTKSLADGGTQAIVVCSAPVPRIGLLVEQNADLNSFSDLLCSCQAVVEKVHLRGLLTEKEYSSAVSQLSLQEKRWADEPVIADGAELYLDPLSIVRLRQVGVLEKLSVAGLHVFINESADVEANRLVAFATLSERQIAVIESIRRSLREGLRSARVIASRSQQSEKGGFIGAHPTLAVLSLDLDVDAIVIDDRCLNSTGAIERSNRFVPIATSLDVLDDLRARQIISLDDFYEYRTDLRRSGYQFIGVSEEELISYLSRAKVDDGGNLIETAELRAIRESQLKAQMSKILQIPLEAPWLENNAQIILRTIRQIWKSMRDVKVGKAKSEWLLALLDMRGFAASSLVGGERNFALYLYAAHLFQLLVPLDVGTKAIRDNYRTWLEASLIFDLKLNQPEIFNWLVEQSRQFAENVARESVKEEPNR